jgi:hypothetical protein
VRKPAFQHSEALELVQDISITTRHGGFAFIRPQACCVHKTMHYMRQATRLTLQRHPGIFHENK